MAAANMKRQSYTTAEKLKVIQFAEQHGYRSAQQEFGMPRAIPAFGEEEGKT